MNIKIDDYVLPIRNTLINILEKELKHLKSPHVDSCTLNFRDPDYSAKTGGYHPVEIMINEQGIIQYITDFSYVGSIEMAELAKDIDFDFASGLLEQFGRCYPIEDAHELFQVWQQNFCAYYEMGVFEVTISTL